MVWFYQPQKSIGIRRTLTLYHDLKHVIELNMAAKHKTGNLLCFHGITPPFSLCATRMSHWLFRPLAFFSLARCKIVLQRPLVRYHWVSDGSLVVSCCKHSPKGSSAYREKTSDSVVEIQWYTTRTSCITSIYKWWWLHNALTLEPN